MSEAPTPRVALIGCGRWGRNIARVLAGLGALELIVDPMADALSDYASELGVRVTSDMTQAFADEIDAVAIAAPAVDHGRLAKLALEAGKPVYVEKPLALDLSEASEVAALAAEKGLPLMIGHLLQYHPAFVTLKQMVDQGAIGEVRHITSHRLNPGAIRTEENALWSMGPHDFSMTLGLAGEEPISVATLPVRVVNPNIPDQYFVQLRFPSGITAQVVASWLSPYKEHKLTVLGTEGALVFEDTAAERDRKLVIYRDYVDTSEATPRFAKGPGEPVNWPAEEPLENEMLAFLDAVRGGDGCRTGPEEAIPVLRLLHAAEAAAEA
ncbi:Gfo/Idh/MocA family protein [Erythrobacter litoralis]|uniref:Probable oxidoreductase n=1 Tax=Erythrobacter litoralis (strain HTCC2594) TaxID=314225 RepID=Q2N6E3_ERYLH|nr:Gfo/Idh/MocA family oxidoreductase [Erythrobacter litoralis]ABC64748.1 probable oxidoreductase [Erythrobacter litoralis HTCC2594]